MKSAIRLASCLGAVLSMFLAVPAFSADGSAPANAIPGLTPPTTQPAFSTQPSAPANATLGLTLPTTQPAFATQTSTPGSTDQRAILAGAPRNIQPAAPAFEALPAEFAEGSGAVRPAWYFHVEGLALREDISGSRAFAALVNTEITEVPPVAPATTSTWVLSETETSVLDMGDLRSGFEGGGRAMIGRTIGPYAAFEASYFEISDFSTVAAVRDHTEYVASIDAQGQPVTTFSSSLFSPFSDFGLPPILGLDYNNLASITYTSSLNNMEWNLRRWILLGPQSLQTSVLVGGRYTNVDQTFGYYTESIYPTDPAPGGSINSVDTKTTNNMLGVQVGAMFKFRADPYWWIDCEIKGVAYDNKARQQTLFVHEGGGVYEGSHSFGRTQHVSTFALDLNLNATVVCTPRLAIRGGYQALWIDGLALAPENFSDNADVLASGPGLLNSKGKSVYHGPHLGITWIF